MFIIVRAEDMGTVVSAFGLFDTEQEAFDAIVEHQEAVNDQTFDGDAFYDVVQIKDPAAFSALFEDR